MQVKQLAQELGITPDTVRFYTRINCLTPHKNEENGYYDYDTRDKNRLQFILNARKLGFSVQDIKDILGHADQKHTPCPTVRRLLEERLEDVEREIQEMVRLRDRMREALEQWQNLPDRDPTGHSICRLIENFNTDPNPQNQESGA